MKQINDFSPTENDILHIRQKLQAYNARHFEIAEELNSIISFIDDEDELIGGIVCTIVGQWLEIDFLWAKDQEQGKGLVEKLLLEAEKPAKEKGSNKAFLLTMVFQAKPFYEKHGYDVV